MLHINEKELKIIRKKSWEITKSYSYPINNNLPLLDDIYSFRPLNDIINRILIINVCCAQAYGFKNELAKKWIESEKLKDFMSKNEIDYIYNGKGDQKGFQLQVESIWGFFYIINKISELKFDKYCSDNLVKMVPDLKNMESSERFKQGILLKSEIEIIMMLDLLYCLNWGQRQFYLDKKMWNYPPEIIEERRKSFEWTISETDWDNISLDT